jgi:hypothetical protein
VLLLLAIEKDVASLYNLAVDKSGSGEGLGQTPNATPFDHVQFASEIVKLSPNQLNSHSNNNDEWSCLADLADINNNLLNCLDKNPPHISPRRELKSMEPFAEALTSELEDAMRHAAAAYHARKVSASPRVNDHL